MTQTASGYRSTATSEIEVIWYRDYRVSGNPLSRDPRPGFPRETGIGVLALAAPHQRQGKRGGSQEGCRSDHRRKARRRRWGDAQAHPEGKWLEEVPKSWSAHRRLVRFDIRWDRVVV